MAKVDRRNVEVVIQNCDLRLTWELSVETINRNKGKDVQPPYGGLVTTVASGYAMPVDAAIHVDKRGTPFIKCESDCDHAD